jgi:hypothetical protein
MRVQAIGLLFALLFESVGCAQGQPFVAIPPPIGKSVVYVYRNSTGYQGSMVSLAVKCDNEKFGEVQNASYVFIAVPAGHHVISSETETKSEIAYDFVAGQSYYITADVDWGFWVGRPRLVMVPEETGKLAILSTKYYSNDPVPKPPNNGYDQGISPAPPR